MAQTKKAALAKKATAPEKPKGPPHARVSTKGATLLEAAAAQNLDQPSHYGQLQDDRPNDDYTVAGAIRAREAHEAKLAADAKESAAIEAEHDKARANG